MVATRVIEAEQQRAEQEIDLSTIGTTAGTLLRRLDLLAELSPSERRALRDLLMQEITSSAASTRAAAAAGLGRIGDDRAVPVLLGATADSDPTVRWHAVLALRSLAQNALVLPGTIDFDEGPDFEQWKAGTIAAIATGLQSPLVGERFSAIASLSAIGEAQGIAYLLAVLGDDHAPVRWSAGEAIVHLARGDVELRKLVISDLTVMLADPDRVVRRSTTDTLGLLGDLEAIPTLLPMLHDVDPGVRWSVYEALGRLGDRRAVAGLIGGLAEDNHWLRRAAALALAAIGSRDAQASLLRVVSDEHPIARAAIIKALGAVGDDTVLPIISAALQESDAGIVQAAIFGIGRLGDRRMLPALRRLRRGPLAGDAQAAIKKIEGRSNLH